MPFKVRNSHVQYATYHMENEPDNKFSVKSTVWYNWSVQLLLQKIYKYKGSLKGEKHLVSQTKQEVTLEQHFLAYSSLKAGDTLTMKEHFTATIDCWALFMHSVALKNSCPKPICESDTSECVNHILVIEWMHSETMMNSQKLLQFRRRWTPLWAQLL